MDYLDIDIILWNKRKDWIDKLINNEVGQIDHDVSEQACALFMELQSVFCAGAWATVLILSMTIIDAQLREINIPDFRGSTEKLIRVMGLTEVIDWLRRRRNSYIHLDTENPEITVNDIWDKSDNLEIEARKAI